MPQAYNVQVRGLSGTNHLKPSDISDSSLEFQVIGLQCIAAVCASSFEKDRHVMVVGFLSHDKVRKLPTYYNGYKLFYP